MKKFLTVLLVIAVMFTFSFGSAFAASLTTDPNPNVLKTTEQAITAITDAAKAAKAQVLKAKNDALFSIFGSDTEATINNVTVLKSSVEKVYDDVLYTKAIAAIDAALDSKLQTAQTAIGNANYAGYFAADGNDYTYTDAAGKVYYYPQLDADFTSVTFVADLDGDGTDDAPATVSSIDAGEFTDLFKKGASDAVAPIGVTKYVDQVGRQVFKDAKDAALTDIRAIDLTAYSKEYKGEAKSNYDLATDLVTAAIEAITAINVASNADWATAVGKVTTATWTGASANGIYAVYKAGVNQADPTGALYDVSVKALLDAPYNTIDLLDLVKVADEPTEETKLEWARTQVLAVLTKNINGRLAKAVEKEDHIILDETLKGAKGDATVIAAAKERKADAQERAAAALEIVTYHVNDCDDLSLLIEKKTPFSSSLPLVDGVTGLTLAYKWKYDPANPNGGLATPLVDNGDGYFRADALVDIVDHVADLKEEAEILKASVAIDGAEYVAIDKALEDAIDKCYKTGTLTNRVAKFDAQQALWARQDELIDNVNGDVKINGRKYVEVASWLPVGGLEDNAITKFDEDYFDEARKAVADTKYAIYASKTIEEAEAAFLAGLEKFEAVPTVADKNAAQATKEFVDLKAKYEAELTAYIDYKENAIASVATDYSWTKSVMLNNLKAELAKAYTTEELTAAYTDAKAEIDGLKTKAELEAAKKAIDEKVAAVKDATAADKEALAALVDEIDEHNDYCGLIGNNTHKVILRGNVDNAIAKIKTAEEDAIKDAIKAIGTVTVEDAEAIKAVKAQLDAFVAFYAGEDADDSEIAALRNVSYNGKTVDNLLIELTNAQVKAFKVMVGKLPADGSDVAGIKAARAAYEELSRAGKNAAYRTDEYDKLLDLEKILAESVKSLKITSSSKATKGAITVTWTVKGNAAAADGYQVWKSTKMNKGYKKAFTTTKTTYKNTKGLKKGVKYYYKVRAYKVVDGVNVYSDWSNKAYRTAK